MFSSPKINLMNKFGAHHFMDVAHRVCNDKMDLTPFLAMCWSNTYRSVRKKNVFNWKMINEEGNDKKSFNAKNVYETTNAM